MATAAADAARAYERADADSPWRPLACLIQGVAMQMTGDLEAARARLDEGSRSGASFAEVSVRPLTRVRPDWGLTVNPVLTLSKFRYFVG